MAAAWTRMMSFNRRLSALALPVGFTLEPARFLSKEAFVAADSLLAYYCARRDNSGSAELTLIGELFPMRKPPVPACMRMGLGMTEIAGYGQKISTEMSRMTRVFRSLRIK